MMIGVFGVIDGENLGEKIDEKLWKRLCNHQLQESNQEDHQIMIIRRDSMKKDAREVKSFVINVVHPSITRRLVPNCRIKLMFSSVFFNFIFS